MGVTGERSVLSDRAVELVSRLREAGDAPIVLGVGISEPGGARIAAAVADGVIVGSALVRRVLEAPSVDRARRELSAAVGALRDVMEG
jgi:tryptophan synthase alpha chain